MAKKTSFSIVKLSAFLISIIGFFFILVQAQFILTPLVFAVFISLLLMPVHRWVNQWLNKPVLSSALVVSFLVVVILGMVTLFSFQIIEVFQDIPAISGKLKAGFNQLVDWAHQQFGFTKSQGLDWLRSNISKVLDAPLKFFGQGLSSSTQFVLDAFITFITVFFILAYRSIIKNLILLQFAKKSRKTGRELLHKIQKAVTQYLSGLLIVIGILAILNSLGLWIIGVGYPIFFGVLAALLVIIPYFGTTIGGIIPFLYSLATFTEWWQPVAVVGMYATIQQIEGNLVTPNIVGSSVKINFLVAFIALIVGGTIWGLSGIILSLPVIAIVKIFCDYIDVLKPLGLLMSNDIFSGYRKLSEEWDDERYRLRSLF